MTSENAYNEICKNRSLIGNGKLEEIIATDADYSYFYARDVLKDRFELGEIAIATNEYISYRYARDAIKGRFELGEAVIKDSYCLYQYLIYVPNTNVFKLVKKILNSFYKTGYLDWYFRGYK